MEELFPMEWLENLERDGFLFDLVAPQESHDQYSEAAFRATEHWVQMERVEIILEQPTPSPTPVPSIIEKKSRKRSPTKSKSSGKRKASSDADDSEDNSDATPPIETNRATPAKLYRPDNRNEMQSFPTTCVMDWKHVLYNLLVENHNSPDGNTILVPCQVESNGELKSGFYINADHDPKKRLAEIYALHIRKDDLVKMDVDSSLRDDLYRYYLRCALQLMTKYFQKAGPWTYLFDGTPLFVPNETIHDAASRLKTLETRQRRRKKNRSATES
eukprot:TRINITY_DN963_c0_g1_i1.p1 TRINITY_DN963_c0_g1~~TRINITY_DN963_c0_g1_i1.p1  ORF type:complete len:307 (+),score=43.31 TRINITY_DN963_c0_g1_i1:104-922(+)